MSTPEDAKMRVTLQVADHHVTHSWLSLRSEADPGGTPVEHHLLLSWISDWAYDPGHRRITLITPGVVYVIGGKATRATLNEPSKTPAVAALHASLAEALLGLSHPWVTPGV